jgi:hypothetical protein
MNGRTGVEIFNLGTGKGTSVLQIIEAFGKACGKKIPYQIDPRRPGDVDANYADCSKAKREMGWEAKYTIDDMCRDSWNWQSKNPNGYEGVAMAATSPDGRSAGSVFADYLGRHRQLIEDALGEKSPRALPQTAPQMRAELDRYLYGPLGRFTASGGKRTRPALCLLGAEAVGGNARDALSVATAIENFQSAALVHDDIADRSELRRGEPCVYVTEGVGVAINVGDLALVVTRQILDDASLADATKLRVLHEVTAMEERTLEGQALDLGWARDGRWDISVDDYLYMASHKTAYYSAAVPLACGRHLRRRHGRPGGGAALVWHERGPRLPAPGRPAQPRGRPRPPGQGLPERHHGGQAHAPRGLGAHSP